jgi:hypothetical protein
MWSLLTMRRRVVTILSSTSSPVSSRSTDASSSDSSSSTADDIWVAISRPMLRLIVAASDLVGEMKLCPASRKPDLGPTERISSISKRSLSIVSFSNSYHTGEEIVSAWYVTCKNRHVHSPASGRRARLVLVAPRLVRPRASRPLAAGVRDRARNAALGANALESLPRRCGAPVDSSCVSSCEYTCKIPCATHASQVRDEGPQAIGFFAGRSVAALHRFVRFARAFEAFVQVGNLALQNADLLDMFLLDAAQFFFLATLGVQLGASLSTERVSRRAGVPTNAARSCTYLFELTFEVGDFRLKLRSTGMEARLIVLDLPGETGCREKTISALGIDG